MRKTLRAWFGAASPVRIGIPSPLSRKSLAADISATTGYYFPNLHFIRSATSWKEFWSKRRHANRNGSQVLTESEAATLC